MALTFTLAALETFLRETWDTTDLSTAAVPNDALAGILKVTDPAAGIDHVIHRDDTETTPAIVLIEDLQEIFNRVPRDGARSLFERIHRFALESETPPLKLPPSWSSYQHDNLVAFFAVPRDWGAWRWVSEIRPDERSLACFWRLTAPGDEVSLENFVPPREKYAQAVQSWSRALRIAAQRFSKVPAPPETEAIQTTVDLDTTGFGAVIGSRTYSSWLPELTPAQTAFIESDTATAVKLRGPAGSGKTLSLEMKVIYELHKAALEHRPAKTLITTHSWAMAEQIDAALSHLAEGLDLSEVDVYPLLSIAQAKLPSEQAGRGLPLLGDDSLEGKRLQIERLNLVLQELLRGDWLAYAPRVSRSMRERMESQRGSAEWNALIWDLLNEFSSVLSAQGILPGVNAEPQYLALARTPWMMPLESDDDRRFVLRVYSDYVTSLRDQRVLTTDQLVNDFLNYLETFTWNILREDEGYDLIVVDELHLFTEQERLVLQYLSRRADEYPHMFMALDPRQSPAEIYMDVPATAVIRRDSGRADQFLGNVQSFELSTVHRFTPEILDLIRHINNMYPALDLGEDWQLDLTDVGTSRGHGDTPSLIRYETQAEEVSGVLDRAADLATQTTRDERTAVIVVEPTRLAAYKAAAEEQRRVNYVFIESRDDVDRLRYARRSVVVGAAEFLGGLQFANVLVAGLPNPQTANANLGHQLRRFLSLLYLAISRASVLVEIAVNRENGGAPHVLESAADAGVLNLAI